MNQIPDNLHRPSLPQINNQNYSSFNPMQRFSDGPMPMSVPIQPNSFGQNGRTNNFQGGGFMNSGDLLVQQFLLENIQKQKSKLLLILK